MVEVVEVFCIFLNFPPLIHVFNVLLQIIGIPQKMDAVHTLFEVTGTFFCNIECLNKIRGAMYSYKSVKLYARLEIHS